MRSRLFLVAGLAMMLLVSACTSQGSGTAGESSESSSSTAVDLAAVDTGTEPAGPSVGDVVAVEDFKAILGDEDLTLAPAL